MKRNIVILLLFFLMFYNVTSQEKSPMTKKDGKVERALVEKIIMEKIGKLPTDTAFMFNATDMMVRGGGNLSLSYSCDVQVKNEIVKSYLDDAVLKVKNGTDLLNYRFHITKTGSATLNVGSSRRQSISIYGSISELN